LGSEAAAGSLIRPEASWSRSPSAALAPFVLRFSLRNDRIGASQIYNPLPARADCFLQFYLEDAYRVVTVATGAVHLAPRCVLVGPHTRRREDIIWTGHLRVFTIRFTEVGLRALFQVPAESIRDYAGAASEILGPAAQRLEELLAGADELHMAPIAERFLMQHFARSSAAADGGIALRMAGAIKVRHGDLTVAGLAQRYGASVRQVERIFNEHVGVSPKMFARLTRLRLALRLGGSGTTDWAEVAAAAGYFDQSHMVREFQALNGATPVEFRSMARRAAGFRPLHGQERDVAFVLSGGRAAVVT
jgi:AraC-like DNA-binding protein